VASWKGDPPEAEAGQQQTLLWKPSEGNLVVGTTGTTMTGQREGKESSVAGEQGHSSMVGMQLAEGRVSRVGRGFRAESRWGERKERWKNDRAGLELAKYTLPYFGESPRPVLA
jgi:hypothetical protein